MKKIYFGSDHGGFSLKQEMIEHFKGEGLDIEDMGTHSTESVDYPDIAKQVCKQVIENDGTGILFCGTGIGICISANKIKGIRAAQVHNGYEARMAKRHNNANVICLGGRTIGPEIAKLCIDRYLKEEFEGGRHINRINKIEGNS